MTRVLLIVLLGLIASTAAAQPGAAELAGRRSRLMADVGSGLVVLRAQSEAKGMEQPSWIQDPSFQYFTGLVDAPGSVLVVDANSGASTLFAAPAPRSFGVEVTALDLQSDPTLEKRTGIEQVDPRSGFVAWMSERLSTGSGIIWVDGPRREEDAGVPEGMRAVTGRHGLWRESLRSSFPNAEIRSASAVIRRLRWAKSPFEIGQLRVNAQASAQALRAGMHAVADGVSQRRAEAAVVAGCLEAGAEGPSFWPWMMSGENAHFNRLVQSFFDYGGMNRVMRQGELVRADVGCMAGGYGGDAGRTVPVSGSFSAEQARVWDLLVTGYLAGVEAMAPGVALDSVRAASRRAILASGDSDLAMAMAAAGGVDWHLHGVGIESGEEAVNPLAEGSVVAYEPMFVFGPDAYYLEDMILVTAAGAEVLTTGLPYTAREMADFFGR